MSLRSPHDWLTLHRVQFAERLSSAEQPFPPVAGAAMWRFIPHYDIGPDGLPTGVSDVWGGVGIWRDRAAAEAAVDAPAELMPWLGSAVASWHALCLPVAHRGVVNWRGHLETDSAVRPAPDDPGGPLLVLTSAGFATRDAATMPRILRFVAGVTDVLEAYGRMPSNVRRAAFRSGFDGRDGYTWSLWRSDQAMREAAYHRGTHRTQIDEDKAGLLSDRSSFTRLRVLRSRGDWDGAVEWSAA